jgi:hypothetical protein
MKNDPSVLLRLLIIHFLVSALIYRKIFTSADNKKFYRSKWVYIASGIYSLLIYCANSSWLDVWIIPCFFTAFLFISIFCNQIKHQSVRLLVFQLILLSLLFSLRIYFSDFQFFSILPPLRTFLNSKRTLLVIFGLVILIWPIGYIIGQITEPFRKQLDDEEVSKGLEKAGMWIGCLERTIIYIFVLSNFLTAIAFLVTAKSIFRFGEITKSRKEAEYILIGTLMSYSIAMVIGFLVKYAVG